MIAADKPGRRYCNEHIHENPDRYHAHIHTFLKTLEMAAMEDDKQISRAEEKALKKARNASEKYKSELLKLKEEV